MPGGEKDSAAMRFPEVRQPAKPAQPAYWGCGDLSSFSFSADIAPLDSECALNEEDLPFDEDSFDDEDPPFCEAPLSREEVILTEALRRRAAVAAASCLPAIIRDAGYEELIELLDIFWRYASPQAMLLENGEGQFGRPGLTMEEANAPVSFRMMRGESYVPPGCAGPESLPAPGDPPCCEEVIVTKAYRRRARAITERCLPTMIREWRPHRPSLNWSAQHPRQPRRRRAWPECKRWWNRRARQPWNRRARQPWNRRGRRFLTGPLRRFRQPDRRLRRDRRRGNAGQGRIAGAPDALSRFQERPNVVPGPEDQENRRRGAAVKSPPLARFAIRRGSPFAPRGSRLGPYTARGDNWPAFGRAWAYSGLRSISIVLDHALAAGRRSDHLPQGRVFIVIEPIQQVGRETAALQDGRR